MTLSWLYYLGALEELYLNLIVFTSNFKDARRPFAATVGQQQIRYTPDAEYGMVTLADDYQV